MEFGEFQESGAVAKNCNDCERRGDNIYRAGNAQLDLCAVDSTPGISRRPSGMTPLPWSHNSSEVKTITSN